jgi:hypothetical protein
VTAGLVGIATAQQGAEAGTQQASPSAAWMEQSKAAMEQFTGDFGSWTAMLPLDDEKKVTVTKGGTWTMWRHLKKSAATLDALREMQTEMRALQASVAARLSEKILPQRLSIEYPSNLALFRKQYKENPEQLKPLMPIIQELMAGMEELEARYEERLEPLFAISHGATMMFRAVENRGIGTRDDSEILDRLVQQCSSIGVTVIFEPHGQTR